MPQFFIIPRDSDLAFVRLKHQYFVKALHANMQPGLRTLLWCIISWLTSFSNTKQRCLSTYNCISFKNSVSVDTHPISNQDLYPSLSNTVKEKIKSLPLLPQLFLISGVPRTLQRYSAPGKRFLLAVTQGPIFK